MVNNSLSTNYWTKFFLTKSPEIIVWHMLWCAWICFGRTPKFAVRIKIMGAIVKHFPTNFEGENTIDNFSRAFFTHSAIIVFSIWNCIMSQKSFWSWISIIVIVLLRNFVDPVMFGFCRDRPMSYFNFTYTYLGLQFTKWKLYL